MSHDLSMKTLRLGLVLLFLNGVSLAHSYEPPADLYRYLATVRTVMDGNTFLADVDLGFGVWMHKTEIRLHKVITPTPDEDLAKGVAAHKYLNGLIKDEERILIQTSYDPTGEYDGWYALVSIWDEDKEAWVSVNDMVIEAGHGTLKQ